MCFPLKLHKCIWFKGECGFFSICKNYGNDRTPRFSASRFTIGWSWRPGVEVGGEWKLSSSSSNYAKTGREWAHGDDWGKGRTRERDRVDGQMNRNMGWKRVGGCSRREFTFRPIGSGAWAVAARFKLSGSGAGWAGAGKNVVIIGITYKSLTRDF